MQYYNKSIEPAKKTEIYRNQSLILLFDIKFVPKCFWENFFSSLHVFPFMYKGDASTFNNWSSGIYSTAINITDTEEKTKGAYLNGTLSVFNSDYQDLKYIILLALELFIFGQGGKFQKSLVSGI